MMRPIRTALTLVPFLIAGVAFAGDEPEPVADPDAVAKDPAPFPRDRFDEDLAVAHVTADDVNLRAGPSVDYPSLGTLPRGALVVVVAEDDDWYRVRVPGGVEVHVFAKLLDHEEGALTGRVRASDVLMRGPATRARLPLHDQRLQLGEEVLVLERKEAEGGAWLRLVAPSHVHVWMHTDYLEEAGRAPARAAELTAAAQARVDAFTGGRTKELRQGRERDVRKRFDAELAKLRALLEVGLVVDAHVDRARALVATAPDDERAAAARALAARLEGARDARKSREARETTQEVARGLEAAARKAKADRERYEREMAELETPRPPSRGKPDVAGKVVILGGKAHVRWGAGLIVRLESRKYRLADYVGRKVRIWGRRVGGKTGSDQPGVLRVDALEIVQ